MSKLTDTIRAGVVVGVGLAGSAIVTSTSLALPFLKLPVIKQVFNWIVNWVIAQLQIQPFLTNFLTDLSIDLERNAKKEAYKQVKTELQAILKLHVKNPTELQNASDDFDKRLGNLIRLHP